MQSDEKMNSLPQGFPNSAVAKPTMASSAGVVNLFDSRSGVKGTVRSTRNRVSMKLLEAAAKLKDKNVLTSVVSEQEIASLNVYWRDLNVLKDEFIQLSKAIRDVNTQSELLDRKDARVFDHISKLVRYNAEFAANPDFTALCDILEKEFADKVWDLQRSMYAFLVEKASTIESQFFELIDAVERCREARKRAKETLIIISLTSARQRDVERAKIVYQECNTELRRRFEDIAYERHRLCRQLAEILIANQAALSHSLIKLDESLPVSKPVVEKALIEFDQYMNNSDTEKMRVAPPLLKKPDAPAITKLPGLIRSLKPRVQTGLRRFRRNADPAADNLENNLDQDVQRMGAMRKGLLKLDENIQRSLRAHEKVVNANMALCELLRRLLRNDSSVESQLYKDGLSKLNEQDQHIVKVYTVTVTNLLIGLREVMNDQITGMEFKLRDWNQQRRNNGKKKDDLPNGPISQDQCYVGLEDDVKVKFRHLYSSLGKDILQPMIGNFLALTMQLHAHRFESQLKVHDMLRAAQIPRHAQLVSDGGFDDSSSDATFFSATGGGGRGQRSLAPVSGNPVQTRPSLGTEDPTYGAFSFQHNGHQLTSPQELPPPRVTRPIDKLILPSSKHLNILVIGETGSGKSTLLNCICNFFRGGDLDNLKVLIPAEHLSVTESDTDHSEADIKNTTLSQTQKCTGYVFTHEGCQFKVIDTPGLADTRGVDVDEANVNKILSTVEKQDNLHAIVMVFNGANCRVLNTMKSVLARFRGILPNSFLDNLVFVFTNCTKHTMTFDVKAIAKELLRPGAVIPEKAQFLMQNSAFKQKPETLAEPESRKELLKDWNSSMETIAALFNYISSMRIVGVNDIVLMRESRERIKTEMALLLAEIKSMDTIRKRIVEAEALREKAGNDQLEFSNYLTTEDHEEWVHEPTTKHNTLCSIHKEHTACHLECGVDKITENGGEDFRNCLAFEGQDACKKCPNSCHRAHHYHAEVKWVKKVTKVSKVLDDMKLKHDQAVKDQKSAQSDVFSAQQALAALDSELKSKMDKIEKACKELKQVCPGFNLAAELGTSICAWEYEITTYTDLETREVLQERIEHMRKLVAALNRDSIIFTDNKKAQAPPRPRVHTDDESSILSQEKDNASSFRKPVKGMRTFSGLNLPWKKED